MDSFIIVYLLLIDRQVFDARKFAKKFNEIARASGKEPLVN